MCNYRVQKNIFNSYENSTTYFNANTELTDRKTISRGVQQECGLSPHLFIII
jgi:hypothetical protein